MQWITDHYLLLGALAAALLGVARVVVKLTATPVDDAAVEAIDKVVEPLLPGAPKK